MKKLASLSALALLSMSAHAIDLGWSATVGTTGLGVQATTPLAPNLNARLGVNFFEISRDVNTNSVNYDANFKLNSVEALADYYPTASAFRLSGGLVYNNNKLEAAGRRSAGGTITLNGTAYNLTSLNGNIDFRSLAPYVGIGWGNAVAKDKGWGFTSDVGILFQGSPRSDLTAGGCTGANCGTLAADLAAENAQLRDKLKNFKAYPVIRIGASYRF